MTATLSRGTANVRGPGDAAIHAGVGRRPVAGAHNWVQTGPRNITGRIRALVFDPRSAQVVYAGAASGGVWKSLDGGRSWFPLWFDEDSLAIGALSVCRNVLTQPAGAPLTIWAATGESPDSGQGFVRGAGIWRSTDDGVNWQRVGTLAQLNQSDQFDALAADPTDPDVCWAVGPRGVFRSRLVGGAIAWDVLEPGIAYSDVAIVPALGGPAGQTFLYLVRTDAQGHILRLNHAQSHDPVVANVQMAIIALSEELLPPAPFPTFAPLNAAGDPQTNRAKIAFSASDPDIAYVAYSKGMPGGISMSAGVFRITNVRARMTGPAPHPAFVRLDPAEWATNQTFDTVALLGTIGAVESQVDYDLCIAVNPANSAHVVVGMREMYRCLNATAAAPTWSRILAAEMHTIDSAQHEDQHALAFEPGGAAAPASP